MEAGKLGGAGRAELARRRAVMNARPGGGWKPVDRKREVSRALRAYAALTRSASFGAVRDPSLVERTAPG